MWAFMPASANWTGSIPGCARCSISGRQASGTAGGSPAASTAVKYRFAKVTSSWVMNAGSAKNPPPRWASTCLVTSRYMRLKQPSPSSAGTDAPIASMRAMAPVTDVTGTRATGPAAGMASLYRRGQLQAGPPGVDDHVVGDGGVDAVMQAEADDTVIVRVERPGRVFAQHGAEGIDEPLREAGPVAARPGRQRDVQRSRARSDDGRLHRKPI